MTDYENTTHLSSWLFTTEELDNSRTRANYEAIRFLEEQRIASETDTKGVTNTATATPTNGGTTTPHILPPQSFAKILPQQRQSNGNDTNDNSNNIESVPSSSPRVPPPLPLPSHYELDRYLTPKEEQALLQFYATKLPTLIGPNAQVNACRKPEKVSSTAALLLKRFYLSNSVMMYDPKSIMVAAAFLASKLEDQWVRIKYIEDGTKSLQSHVSIHSIINSEVALIKGIDYDLLCFHPYSTLQAYTDDLRSFKSKNSNGDGTFRRYVSILDVGEADDGGGEAVEDGHGHRRHKVDARDLVAQVYKEAQALVETVLYTKCGDVALIATPGQIGLAAMYVANERLIAKAKAKIGADGSGKGGSAGTDDVVQIDFEGYITNRFMEKKRISKVWDRVKEVGTILEEESKWEHDMGFLKGINRKLKGCRVWGTIDGKKKKKKVKKRKRTEEGAVVT